MQRGLIRQISREQRGASSLMLDLQSRKSVLPDRIKVLLHTDLHSHLSPPFFGTCGCFSLSRKGVYPHEGGLTSPTFVIARVIFRLRWEMGKRRNHPQPPEETVRGGANPKPLRWLRPVGSRPVCDRYCSPES